MYKDKSFPPFLKKKTPPFFYSEKLCRDDQRQNSAWLICYLSLRCFLTTHLMRLILDFKARKVKNRNTKIEDSGSLTTPSMGTSLSKPPTFLSGDGPLSTRNTVIAARRLPFLRHHVETKMAALHTFGFREGLSKNRRHVKGNVGKMCCVHLWHMGTRAC